MAIILSDGFEAGSISQPPFEVYPGGSTFVTSAVKRTGAYSIRCDHSAGGWKFGVLLDYKSEFYAESWMYTAPTASGFGIKHNCVSADTWDGYVGIQNWWTTGTWGSQWYTLAYPNTPGHWTGSGYTTLKYYTALPPQVGEWMKIAIHCKSNTSGNNDGILRYWHGLTDFDPRSTTPAYESTSFRWADNAMTFRHWYTMGNPDAGDGDDWTCHDDILVLDTLDEWVSGGGGGSSTVPLYLNGDRFYWRMAMKTTDGKETPYSNPNHYFDMAIVASGENVLNTVRQTGGGKKVQTLIGSGTHRANLYRQSGGGSGATGTTVYSRGMRRPSVQVGVGL
jgi:hypothetical protein